MNKRETSRQAGFTMPELLVVGGVLIVLIIVSAFLVHPVDYGSASRNAKRATDTAQIAQAFNKYVAEHGEFPEGITSEPQVLGSEQDMLNLCDALVPAYLKDMPLDPVAGGTVHEKACDPEDPLYTTGYTIHINDKGELVIDAPVAEKQAKINQVRAY